MATSIRTTERGDSCEVAVVAASEEVARLRILDRQMRMGAAWVRIGAIAGVRVKPGNRGKGWGHELMQGAHKYMADNGYILSVLFGIPDFYHRFGYSNILLSKSLVRVKTAAGESLGTELAVREAKPTDTESLLAVYNAANGGLTGTLARKAVAFSQWFEDEDDWWQEERRIIVTEDKGTPVAYALGDPEWLHEGEWNMRAYEIGALPEYTGAGTSSLVRALAAEAAERRAEWLTFEMPPDSPQLSVLKPIGFTQEIEYARNQGGMGRIMDLDGLAVALRDSLRDRWRLLGLQGRVGEVDFVCDAERAEMNFGAGRTLSINLAQQYLLQLLMGYRSITELRLDFPDCVAEEDVGTIDMVFPVGHPYMWRLDHF